MGCGLMEKRDAYFHIIWGIVLVLMGVAVIFHVPQQMDKIAKLKEFESVPFFIRFCFYLLGVLLIGGGVQKIVKTYREMTGKQGPNDKD
jgi:uncharacterized membrane protein HdeD (DUF308 family)